MASNILDDITNKQVVLPNREGSPEYGTVKHVMVYDELKLPMLGVEEIVAWVKHSGDAVSCNYRTCNEKRDHYHYIVKFTQEHVERCKQRKCSLIPYIYKGHVKNIQDKNHYDNLIKYMAKYDEFTPEELEKIESFGEHVRPAKKARKLEVDMIEDKANITEHDLDTLKQRVDNTGSAFLAKTYLDMYYKFNNEQAVLRSFESLTRHTRPMSEHEHKVMCYDYQNQMSAFRVCHLIDIWFKRLSHPTKSDKCPIFILCGETSCGKSKIALAFANSIGTCTFPITSYTHNDILALSDWFKTNSDVLVFDDFSFTAASDPTQPSKIFNNLKQWASGVEVHFRTSQSQKRSISESFSTRMVKAIIISVNEITRETQELCDTMPEMRDRFEFIPFGSKYSYDPVLNRQYVKRFDDSARVSDRCLRLFASRYKTIAQRSFDNKRYYNGQETPEWCEYINKYGMLTLPNARDIISTYDNYPYSNGLYHPQIVEYHTLKNITN